MATTERELVIDKLTKIRGKLKGKTFAWPPGEYACPTCGTDITFQLAGLFLREHIDIIIEALHHDPDKCNDCP